MLLAGHRPFLWPEFPIASAFPESSFDNLFRSGPLNESPATVAGDSRWPAFFPSPICLMTAGEGPAAVVERVVGPTIVNRFPLVMALSLCREDLSPRHYARRVTMRAIEQSGRVSVQFLAPGPTLDRALDVIAAVPDARATARLAGIGAPVRPLPETGVAAFDDAYLVYEGRLAEPGRTPEGYPALAKPWYDAGSHRTYFVEVLAIYLTSPVARGERQIAWHSLPQWTPAEEGARPDYDATALGAQGYVKGYTPNYRFPAQGTVAFEADSTFGAMSVRHLERLPGGQVQVDNDRARWPCFFPSSAGMITTWQDDGRATAMPCGSTCIVSRLPFTVATCISNSSINARYAPRASLATIRARGRFGVGVPFAGDDVVRAMSYLGNVSARTDPDKVRHAGLTALPGGPSPVLADLPVHLDCRVTDELVLGTHIMVFGEVDRVHVRRDLGPANPLRWSPWATVV